MHKYIRRLGKYRFNPKQLTHPCLASKHTMKCRDQEFAPSIDDPRVCIYKCVKKKQHHHREQHILETRNQCVCVQAKEYNQFGGFLLVIEYLVY